MLGAQLRQVVLVLGGGEDGVAGGERVVAPLQRVRFLMSEVQALGIVLLWGPRRGVFLMVRVWIVGDATVHDVDDIDEVNTKPHPQTPKPPDPKSTP